MEWNIGYIVKKRASLMPDKHALIFEDEPVTYRKLNEESNRIACHLHSLGLKKGDRISVLLLNCPEFLYTYFAAAKLGLIFVPLNFRLVGPEIRYQINKCGARLLIFHDLFVGIIESIKEEITIEEDKFIYLESLGQETHECPKWAVSYKNSASNCSTREPTPTDKIMISDPLAILFTSGVTGSPKGAVLSHEQTFFKCFQNMLYDEECTVNDISLTQAPLFHSAGLFIAATPAFCRGATLAIRQGFDPIKFAEDIEKYKATNVFAFTTMWRFILESGKLDQIDTSSVRRVSGGGERTPVSLLEDLGKRGLHMQQGFGQTENSAMMTLPKNAIIRKQGSIGLPGFFTDVWICDDNGNRLPPNEVGEIVAMGPTVMSGYWDMPEKTAETIVNGVLHTGDLGYMDEDGYFYIVDRAKDMYRSGGENVYPAEVEKILADHPKIALVTIIGVTDEKWGEVGKVFVVPNKGKTITLEEIHTFLEGKVARYKYPKQIQLLDKLPMTTTGKIKKVELKEKYGVRFDA